jgi:hypothetical protein
MAAFFDLETAQGHANTSSAVGKRVSIAAGFSVVDRFFAPELNDAAVPEGGVFPLGGRQVAQDLGAYRVGVALGQGEVGVIGLYLGVPVFFKSLEDLFELCRIKNRGGHGYAPEYVKRVLV